MFGISRFVPYSTLRFHSSHSKPHVQCVKQQPLLWSCALQTPPLRKLTKSQPLLGAAQDQAYRQLKTW